MNQLDMLVRLAAAAAVAGDKKRNFFVGASALRKDGTYVKSNNGCVHSDTTVRTKLPYAHAEARLAKKLDIGATVCVIRVKRSGGYGLALPCRRCMELLKRNKVRRIYFSTADGIASLLLKSTTR